VITWLNAQEAAGMLTAMGLVFAGLWHGPLGSVFRRLLRRAARGRHAAGRSS